MKIKLKIDTEELGDNRDLLLLANREKFFNFAFDLGVNLNNQVLSALNLPDHKSCYTLDDFKEIILYVLDSNGISSDLIQELS